MTGRNALNLASLVMMILGALMAFLSWSGSHWIESVNAQVETLTDHNAQLDSRMGRVEVLTASHWEQVVRWMESIDKKLDRR